VLKVFASVSTMTAATVAIVVWLRRSSTSSQRRNSSLGDVPVWTSVEITVRNCDMRAAAPALWPTTSPTISAVRRESIGTTSNQSPPKPSESIAGT